MPKKQPRREEYVETPTTETHDEAPPGTFVARIEALRRSVRARPDDPARAHYAALISPERATAAGGRVESGAVLEDFLTVTQKLLPLITDGTLATHGYGPLRLAAALEVCASLAQEIGIIDAALVRAAGAAGHADVSLRSAAVVRARALAVLRNSVSTADIDGQRRLREARRSDPSANDRARSLAAIAEEVQRRIDTLPASVAKDSGVTPELVAALRVHVAALDSARANHVAARGDATARYEVMDLLDGRLLHELRAMLAAYRALRKQRPALGVVRSTLLRSGRRARRAPAPPAPVS